MHFGECLDPKNNHSRVVLRCPPVLALFFRSRVREGLGTDVFFLFQPHQECPSGTSVRSLAAAGYAVRRDAAAGGGGGRAWPQTLAERHERHGGREGTPRQSPGTPEPQSLAEYSGRQQLYFLYRSCLFFHPRPKRSSRTFGAELKLPSESKQLPSVGTRLKLARSVPVLRDSGGSGP